MTPDQWTAVQALVEAALAAPPEARAAFLATATDDPLLRAEAEALLAGADDLGDFLASPLVAAAMQETTVATVGPYRLVEEIGHGGMGVVYLAERDDGLFEQQVAVKVLPLTQATQQARQRFEAERRILARLEHSHIARLLDGGITEAGVPYLVMEYVAGQRIDDYCDARRLTIAERLRLFVQVGQAVAYAHSRLVIHRDLKPSNVLVTADGQVKLLDFGIAKLLDPDTEDLLPRTRTDARLMTPEYAAPEQVLGEPVTTATDVYALGVLLYELLTGRRPLALTGLALPKMAHRIQEDQPPRPSRAVTQTDEPGTRDTISAVRRTRPEALRRRLSGDLDVLCLKALRKEPQRRYASVEALLEDIRRHQASLPIRARRDTLTYRTRKYVGRHRTGVAVALVLLLASGVGGWLYATHIQQARQRAEAEAAKATQAVGFLTELFFLADPSQALGEDLTVRTLLDKGRERIAALESTPLLQAEMRSVLGVIYTRLNQPGRALGLLAAAQEQQRALLPADHPDRAETALHLADAYFAAGALDTAAATLATLADHPRWQQPDWAARRLRWLTTSAAVADLRGDHALIDARYQEALPQLRERPAGVPAPEWASRLVIWLDVLINRNDYEEVEVLLDQVEPLLAAHFAPTHPSVLLFQHLRIKATRHVQGTDEALLAHAEEVLAQTRRLYPEGHLDVARQESMIGTMLSELYRYEEAIAQYEQALRSYDAFGGHDHPSRLIALEHLTYMYLTTEQIAAADSVNREARLLGLRRYGAGHPLLGIALGQRAEILARQEQLTAADSVYTEAVGLLGRGGQAQRLSLAEQVNNHGLLKVQQGDNEAALGLFERAAALYTDVFGVASVENVIVLTNMAAVLRSQGRYDEAEQRYMEVLQLEGQVDEDLVGDALLGLGRLYLLREKPRRAQPLLERALALYRDYYPAGDWNIASAAGALGDAHAAVNDAKAAEPLLVESFETLLERRGAGHPVTAERRAALVAFYETQGREEQAARYRQ